MKIQPITSAGFRGLTCLGLLLAGWGCGWVGDDASPPVEEPPAPPPRTLRVASLSPLATRFVLALGAGSMLVGVDAGSAHHGDLARLPVVGFDDVAALAPDLVLAPTGFDEALTPDDRFEIAVFAPHDLEDLFELCQTLGHRLVGLAAASQFEARLARPLAEIGGESFGRGRPRVVALVALDPPTLAGGHSFETDLIEIAGGRSVTHGGDATRLDATPATLARLAPELVVILTREGPSEAAIERARIELALEVPVESLTVTFDDVFEGGLIEHARALRRVILRYPSPSP